MNQDQVLTVQARAPFELYYRGSALSVSAINKVGKFDILPGHADFFSVINPGDILIETENEEITIPVTSGIVCVKDDEVLLFLNF